jgi:hypothetical protein
MQYAIIGQCLEEEQKLFMYKEEEKKRIWAEEEKEEEPLTNLNSMAPPRRHTRSSRTSRSCGEYQPGDAQPSPVLQGVVNSLKSISKQMLGISGRSGENGGWPWFDGTYKEYTAFHREWNSHEKHHHQQTQQMELV